MAHTVAVLQGGHLSQARPSATCLWDPCDRAQGFLKVLLTLLDLAWQLVHEAVWELAWGMGKRNCSGFSGTLTSVLCVREASAVNLICPGDDSACASSHPPF